MTGILLACGVSSILFYCDNPQLYWKWPFYGSVVTGVAGWWLRRQVVPRFVKKELIKEKFNSSGILRLIPIIGFSYILYSAPFVFFNSFAALVTSIDIKDLMITNTFLMVFDMGLLAFRNMRKRSNHSIGMAFSHILAGKTKIKIIFRINKIIITKQYTS